MGDGTKKKPLTFEEFFDALENCEKILEQLDSQWLREYGTFIDKHGYTLAHDVVFCSTYLDFTNK